MQIFADIFFILDVILVVDVIVGLVCDKVICGV